MDKNVTQLGAIYKKLHHTLDHKSNLNIFKGMEIIQSMLSDHNVVKLEFNNKDNRKISKHLEINTSEYSMDQRGSLKGN